MSDTSKEILGQTMQGISAKSREPNIQKVAGAVSHSLQFKVFFEWFMNFQDTVLSDFAADTMH